MAGHDLAAQVREDRAQSIRECLAAAARDGPAGGVGQEREEHAVARRAGVGERLHRVRRDAGEERPWFVVLEAMTGEGMGAADRMAAERGRGHRVVGRVEWCQERRDECVGASHERIHQPRVVRRVGPGERGRGLGHVASQERRPPVVEGMRDRDRRMAPLDAVVRQPKVGEGR